MYNDVYFWDTEDVGWHDADARWARLGSVCYFWDTEDVRWHDADARWARPMSLVAEGGGVGGGESDGALICVVEAAGGAIGGGDANIGESTTWYGVVAGGAEAGGEATDLAAAVLSALGGGLGGGESETEAISISQATGGAVVAGAANIESINVVRPVALEGGLYRPTYRRIEKPVKILEFVSRGGAVGLGSATIETFENHDEEELLLLLAA